MFNIRRQYFFGHALSDLLTQAQLSLSKASIFTCLVNETQRYVVSEFDLKIHSKKLIEKPLNSNSKHAITGFYFYDSNVFNLIRCVKIEDREKFTVTDLNQLYLESKNLNIISLPSEVRWFDAGVHEARLEVANFVSMCEREDNFLVGCPEAVAWQCHYINDQQLKCLIDM